MTAPLVRRSPVHRAEVVGTQRLTPRMQRVTLRCEAVRDIVLKPAQDVELHLHEETGRRVKRRYTIRSARLDAGELDLDVLLHGEHPGSTWGVNALPGDEVTFQGPRGKLDLRASSHHLLIGDESALPAIASICEALPAGERATALIEIGDESDQLPVAATDVRWVARGGAPAGTADLLAAAMGDIGVPGGTHAYLMGESRAMIALRSEVERRGVPHDAVFVKGYWNVGRPDRIANRPPR